MASNLTQFSAMNDNTTKNGSKNANDNVCNPNQINFQEQNNQINNNSININNNDIDDDNLNRDKIESGQQTYLNLTEDLSMANINEEQQKYNQSESAKINNAILLNKKLIMHNKKDIDDVFLNQLSEILVKNNYILKDYLIQAGLGDVFIAEQNRQQFILKIYSQVGEEQFKKELEFFNSNHDLINTLGNIELIELKDISVYIVTQKKFESTSNQEIVKQLQLDVFTKKINEEGDLRIQNTMSLLDNERQNLQMRLIKSQINLMNDTTFKKGHKKIKDKVSDVQISLSQNNSSNKVQIIQSQKNINNGNSNSNNNTENYETTILFNIDQGVYSGQFDQLIQENSFNELNDILNKNILILQKGNIMQNIFKADGIKFIIIQQRLIEENYILQEYLTSGGQGDIFVAEKNGQSIILKIYTGIEEEEFDEELNLINSINEPINILRNIDAIKLKDINVYIVVQEKCELNLKEEIELFKTNKKEFTELNLLIMIFDLLDGLIEMRSHNIIHQDIKPANILKTYSGKYVYTDFGLSSKLQGRKSESKGYTRKYCAPEQLKGDVNYQSDVYSLGKTILFVIEAYQQFQKEKSKQNLSNMSLGRELTNLVQQKMLQNKYNEREEIMQLLKYFFQLVNKARFSEFNLAYKNKLNQIILAFPFDNSKDIHYFSYAHLQYSIFYVKTLQIIKKSIQQMNNFMLERQKYDEIADSLSNVGLCYHSLGQYGSALEFLLEGLEINKIVFKENHSSIADSLHNIALCYDSMGQYELALKYLLEALEMNKLIFIGNHSRIANSLNNIGLCYNSLGQYDLALKYVLEAVEMKKIVFSGNHESIADSLNNLGNCYQSLEQYDLALKYLLEALEMKKKVFQKNHSSIASSLNNVGNFYRILGQYDLALKYYRKALEINKIVFSGKHSSIAGSLNNLGSCYRSLGKYDLALNHQLQALEMNKIIFSENHPSIADSLNNVGLCYDSLNQYDLSLKYLLQALEVNKIIFSGNHPSIAGSLNNVGNCYILLKEYDLALKYQLEALEMKKKVFKKNHSSIASSLNNVGNCYKYLEQYDLALKYNLEALEMKKNIFQGTNSTIASSSSNVGLCYDSLGQHELALKYLIEAVEMNKIIFPENHPNIADSLQNLGNCYSSLEQYDLALKHELEALEIYKKILPKHHPSITDSLQIIGVCYISLKQYDQALKYLLEAVEINKMTYSGNHSSLADCLDNVGSCYILLGEYNQSYQYHLEALEIKKIIFSSAHLYFQNSLEKILQIYLQHDQKDLALKLIQEFYDILINNIDFKTNFPIFQQIFESSK